VTGTNLDRIPRVRFDLATGAVHQMMRSRRHNPALRVDRDTFNVRAMCADGQEPASFGILNSVQSVLVAMRKSTIRSGTKCLDQWLLGLAKSWLFIAPGHLGIDSLVDVKQHIRVSVVPLAHLAASKIEHDLRSSHTCVKAAELQNKILKFPPRQLRLHHRSLE
jgi:hypothetical protein